MDTWESRTRDLEEKKFGLLAKEIVESYCPVDEYTTLKTSKDERGKFGRILGDFLRLLFRGFLVHAASFLWVRQFVFLDQRVALVDALWAAAR